MTTSRSASPDADKLCSQHIFRSSCALLLAVTLQEGQAVLQAWKRTSLTAMVGFNYRFNGLYETARRIIHSGALGEIVAVRTVFSLPTHPTPEWKRSVANGGGVLFDLPSSRLPPKIGLKCTGAKEG